MDKFRFSPRPNRAHEIRWREWGPEAFQEARTLDRPILLAISAVWCHWCHVMDETSYSDPRVIMTLNQEYIPVRVDNDRNPEVNQRYNMGGWPSTAFLTPQGDILTGATYVPADGLLAIASQVLQYYRTRKAELYSRILEQKREATAQGVPASVPADAPTVVTDYLQAAYDLEYGGFGNDQKFPQAGALEFLIEQYHDTGDRRLELMAATTLKNMADGGLFDQVAGGFFRYSTNRDWSVPHYEKMAEDNASLLRLYLHAYQALGLASSEPVSNGHPVSGDELRSTAGRVADYVISRLLDPETGGFFGSQDADEEYYQLDPAERARRDEPLVDRTVYTPWTAMMASSFLGASRVLDRPELEEVALRSLEFLWQTMRPDGQGLSHYYDTQPRGSGLLIDQTTVIAALLDAYEATGRPFHLDRAVTLARLVLDQFQDRDGGFFDIREATDGLGRLAVRDKSIVENSLTAVSLLRIHYLTANDEYRAAAERAIGVFASDYMRYGPYASTYGRAVKWLVDSPLQIEISGEPDRTRPLRQAAMAVYHPRRLVHTLGTDSYTKIPGKLGLPAPDGPAAYICYRQTCSAPVINSSELASAVERLISGSAR